MTKITKEIAEFVGAFIGDGYMGVYGLHKNNYVVGISGNRELDKEYLYYLKRIVEKSFLYTLPHIYPRFDANSIDLKIYSKRFFNYMVGLGFRPGKKTYDVRIPPTVLSQKEILTYVIRGIFDTDGCIFFDKRVSYSDYYPRIDLHLANPGLVKQVYNLLLYYCIRVTATRNYDRIQINGKKNVMTFSDIIGFSNKRHLLKIRKAPGRI